MNFELSEDQSLLRESVSRVLSDIYSFEQRRATVATQPGWSAALWQQLSDLGVTGLVVPERWGGFGGRMQDLAPLWEVAGKHLVIEPIYPALLAATALRVAGSEARERLLPSIARGECIVAWGHQEPGARHASLWVEATARQEAGRWYLTGTKLNVLHAPSAQHIVVSVRTGGAPGSLEGVALFLLDPRSAGVTLRPHRLIDDTPAAELRMQDAVAEPLGDPLESAAAAIDQVLRHGVAAACADAVGTMQAAYDLSIVYLNTRKQFGRLIGENQALRHRAAEMLVQLGTSRTMAMLAAAAVDGGEGAEPIDLTRARLVIGRNARNLCHTAIQLHGGIGMTEEYAVGHCLRRVVVLEQMYGDAKSQALQLAQAQQSAQ